MLAGMNVLFLFGNFELGGAERQALFLARHLQEQERARVEVWGIGETGPVSALYETWGISCKSMGIRLGSSLIVTALKLLPLILRMRRAAPDVLLPYTWFPNVLCGLIWRMVGAGTCIWNQRDSGFFLDPTRMVHRLSAKLTPCFISNSSHAATYLMDSFKVDRQRIAIIPNGVHLEPARTDRRSWRRLLGVEEQDFVGCMLANFSIHKDHATAVKAWRMVVDRLATSSRRALLVLAGRDDGTAESIRSLLRELDLERDVRILGFVDDVTGLLASCDIGIQCAEHEGCPNAVLEEMAAGLPVVASDSDGVRAVLGEGGDAFLARYQDAEGIAHRIVALAADSDARVMAGTHNRQRIRNQYSVEVMCAETTGFIAAQRRGRNEW